MIHSNEIKIILSIEKTDQIIINSIRSQCYMNLYDEHITIQKIKDTIRKYYYIPSTCDFTLAYYQPFDDQLNKKVLLQGDPNSMVLRERLFPYVTETEVYGDIVEQVLHFHLYPSSFMVNPIIFTLNDRFPEDGTMDYSIVKENQEFPLGFIQYHWTYEELIEQFQILLFHYVYSHIPGVSNASTEYKQFQLQLYNLAGEEHHGVESIIHNDPIVVRIKARSGVPDSTGLIEKLRQLFQRLQWIETPLVPFTKRTEDLRKAWKSNLMQIVEIDENFASPVSKAHVEKANINSALLAEIQQSFSVLGVRVSPINLGKLISRSSTLDGAMNYYFENPDLFNDNPKEDIRKADVDDETHTTKNFPDTSTVDEMEELSYLRMDLPQPLPKMNAPSVLHPAAPPLPPNIPRTTKSISTSSANASMFSYPCFSEPYCEKYYLRFKELGFELNEVQIQELILRASTFDGMLNYYLSNLDLFHPNSPAKYANSANGKKRSETPSYEKQCLICFCDYPMEEMYGLNCCDNHYFCISCLLNLIKFAINGSEDTAPYIPACPLANRKGDGCEYVLQEHECQQIIELARDSKTIDTLTYVESERLIKKVKRLYLTRAYYAADCVRCPTCPSELEDEAYWISLPPDGRKRAIRVDCPTCNTTFCSACMRHPYHYRCECDQVTPYMRGWMEWIAHGRREYLKELSKHEEKYRQAFEEYDKKRKEHEKEVKEAEDRFREVQENETALAKFCKSCPHCGFRIEKIDGCDAMKCGHDYHGNSIGLGCGKTFHWSTAPPYTPNAADKKMPEELNVVAPAKAFEIHHEIEEGVPLPCDYCGSSIIGPKIQCLNCPSYTLCIHCSSNVDFCEVDPFGHHNSHTCKVIFEV